MNTEYHEPVLVSEVCEYLVTSHDGTYVDATTGGGGHTKAILETVSHKARVVCFDRDPDAIDGSIRKLQQWESQVTFICDVFGNIQNRLRQLSISKINGILFDLGISSFQINNADRGFSYQQNAKLDMRMDKGAGITAIEVLQTYNERELADLFFYYGEERKARQIARKVVEERNKRTILTSTELSEIIRLVVGERHLVKSLARIFQALRIEVNAELDQLSKALDQTTDLLQTGGRLVVISYHSLEDRIVKHFMKERSAKRKRSEDPFARQDIEVDPDFRIVTKKPVLPDLDEQRQNPRSRSAKLRVAERC
jgi:16S rRNA (cytosine1402-N4)-methyltransferase